MISWCLRSRDVEKLGIGGVERERREEGGGGDKDGAEVRKIVKSCPFFPGC